MKHSQNGAVDWERVYWEQMPRIYNFFRYRIHDNHVAQDLTATTFLKAWGQRHRYRADVGAFEAWLFTIARNTAIDYARQQPLTLHLDYAEQLLSEQNVEVEVQQRHDLTQLASLLNKLTDTDKELVALKYGADLSNRAIARIINLSESNVGTRLHRIISKLRREWETV